MVAGTCGMIDTVKEELIREIEASVGGRAAADEMMSLHTTLRVGGPAEIMVEPADLPALLALLRWAKLRGVETTIIGAGSNILVADGGVGGVVIRLSAPPFETMAAGEGRLVCGAGAGIAELVRFCGEEGLSGLEFLSSIPGTVGGAIAMNAGAWGMDVAAVLKDAVVVNDEGSLSTFAREEIDFGYRRCVLPEGKCIVSGTFAVERRPAEEVREAARRYAAERGTRFPPGPSAGSIFKNPRGDYAGRLIEAAGLKGMTCGGAQISEAHANFIVNRGGASAGDVLRLISMAREAVERKFAVSMETEIHILGGVER